MSHFDRNIKSTKLLLAIQALNIITANEIAGMHDVTPKMIAM